MDWIGLGRIGLGWAEPDWAGLGCAGLSWSGLELGRRGGTVLGWVELDCLAGVECEMDFDLRTCEMFCWWIKNGGGFPLFSWVFMPRFSEAEKEIIREKMLQEGERLFTLFGIKKVSIDEIVQATGIAKGSFYSFYPNKESLYMDIAGNLQKKMWSERDEFLNENSSLPPRVLCKKCFLCMFNGLQKYPILKRADNQQVIMELMLDGVRKEMICEDRKSRRYFSHCCITPCMEMNYGLQFFFNYAGEEILWRGYILPRQLNSNHGKYAMLILVLLQSHCITLKILLIRTIFSVSDEIKNGTGDEMGA